MMGNLLIPNYVLEIFENKMLFFSFKRELIFTFDTLFGTITNNYYDKQESVFF